MAKLVWVVGLMKEIGIDVKLQVNMYNENKADIPIAANSVYHGWTNYIEIDCHFIRDKIIQGLISTNYISISEQPADILTKGLAIFQHEILRSKL